MSGRAPGRKGRRLEREIVHLHRALGILAERVPLSGSAGGSFAGDVLLPGIGRGEVKGRRGGQGFRVLERWLGSADALFLRRNHAAPLVVLPWSSYARLLERARADAGHRDGEG